MVRIALLTGGTSTEREISLRSAAHVATLLQPSFTVLSYDLPRDLPRFLEDRHGIDVAIPLIHGRGGEDGSIQGMLQQLGIPFLFSSITAHAIGIDKALTKTVVGAQGVPVSPSTILRRGDSLPYSRPIAIKQLDGGSSLGVLRVDSQASLDTALETLFQQYEHVLVETWIEGREYTVGVIDDDLGRRALPVTLIQPHAGTFFDYTQKYSQASLAEELCPAPLDAAETQKLQELAIAVHAAVDAKQVSRSDFIVDTDGTIWFLEINTIPGMTETSLLPKMLTVEGTSLKAQLTAWIESTLHRST